MNTVDKITRDSRILIDSAKDSATTNLMNAFRQKEISLSEEQLNRVVNLINTSIDQGYQRAISSFQNTIKKHF